MGLTSESVVSSNVLTPMVGTPRAVADLPDIQSWTALAFQKSTIKGLYVNRQEIKTYQ